MHVLTIRRFMSLWDQNASCIAIGYLAYLIKNVYLNPDAAKHKVLDLVLVFDASYTITTSGWYKIKKAAKQLVDGLDIAPQGTHVSLMKYSTDVETFRIFEQDDDKEKIMKQIDDLTYDGEWSRMDLAAKAVDEHVFSSGSGARLGDVPKAVIFFTDGRTDGMTKTMHEINTPNKVKQWFGIWDLL